jgi:hypothetical protein
MRMAQCICQLLVCGMPQKIYLQPIDLREVMKKKQEYAGFRSLV